jgi:hypothetical protein
MARLPIYTQKYGAQAPNVTNADMGAETGRAIQNVGLTLMDLGERSRLRSETINRVRDQNAFDQIAQSSLTELEMSEDFANPEVLKTYQNTLRAQVDQIVSNHGGSNASRAQLRATLENQFGQYAKLATGAQLKAQNTLIGNAIDAEVNSLSANTQFAPELYTESLARIDQTIDQYAPALSSTLEAEYRRSAKSKVIASAAQAYLTNGNYTAARELLSRPEAKQFMSTADYSKIGNDIIVEERKTELETQRVNQNVARYTMLAGRDLTPEEIMRVQMLPAKKDMTAADDILAYEVITGKPAGADVTAKAFGMYIEGGNPAAGDFGPGVRGRALTYVNNNLAGFKNNLLDPESEQTFLANAFEAYGPAKDPVTGTMINRPVNSIPPHVREAFATRGMLLPGQMPAPQGPPGMGGAPTMGAPAPAQPTMQADVGVGQPTMPGVEPPFGPQTAEAVSPDQVFGTQVQQGQEGRTIWQRSETVAGIVPSAAEFAGRTPIVGGALFEGGGQFAQDRQYVTAKQKDLVRVLQNNPRYAEGERQAIENEISIDSSVFDNPTAYKQRLIAIDEALRQRMQNAYNTSQNTMGTTAEERQHAMNVVNGINQFLESLGVPPRVKSPEEAKKLPPGAEFVTPDGRLLRNTLVGGEQ